MLLDLLFPRAQVFVIQCFEFGARTDEHQHWPLYTGINVANACAKFDTFECTALAWSLKFAIAILGAQVLLPVAWLQPLQDGFWVGHKYYHLCCIASPLHNVGAQAAAG